MQDVSPSYIYFQLRSRKAAHYLYDTTEVHGFFSVIYKQFWTLKSSQSKHQISQMIPSVTKFSILSTAFLKLIFNSPTAPVLSVFMEKGDTQSILRLML